MRTTTSQPGNDPLGQEVEALLAYALGITDQRPTLVLLPVQPEQAAEFIREYLQSRGLTVQHRQSRPAPEPVTPSTANERARAIGILECCRAANRPTAAAGMIAEGLTVAEALARLESPAVEDVEARLRDLATETETTWHKARGESAALQREFGCRQGDFMAFMRARARGLC